MAFFNYSTMQMAAKVVYYGPGLGGKTTNLQYIYGHTSKETRGEMVSLETATDRTLFFDLLPLEVGTVAGFKTRIQLYTVPGQVFYNTTRKLVLKGVDGVVFVADSQKPMLQANIDSLRNLQENLAELDLELTDLPLVLQFNKRDLSQVCTTEELNKALNWNGWPFFEASAVRGTGVFETLKEISKLSLIALRKRIQSHTGRPAAEGEVEAPRFAEVEAAAEPPAPRSVVVHAAGGPAGGEDAFTGDQGVAEILTAASEASPGNGRIEITHDVAMALSQEDLERARRFSLSLRVEDERHRVVHKLNGVEVELEPQPGSNRLLLRLNIALDARE